MKSKILWLFFLNCSIAFSQVESLNRLPLKKDSLADYSFIVSGHLHGDGISSSGLPAATLLANLDSINNSKFAFFVSLGDLFKDIKNDLPTYKKLFLSKLTMPIYNAVGNHDLSGTIYEKEFAKTYFSFSYKSEQFVFLDAEMNNSSILNDQLDFFKAAIESASKNNEIKNVFFFTHRPIWAEEDEELKNVFKYNTRSGSGNNYQKELLPLLKQLAKTKPVFWFSGSMDTAPAAFFYHKLKDANITLMQTAIRNQKKDAALIVQVNNGQINFRSFSFTGEVLNEISTYDLKYYQKAGAIATDESLNIRLIPLYMKQIFTSRYFWYGILLSAALVGLLNYRKRKRR